MRGRAPSPAGLAIALAVALGAPAASAEKPAGLAPTPPMGWNSWNRFGCEVGEELIRRTADAMAASGMREAGYRYVVIDDCWQGERDERGFLRPDPERFPSGMKALADYVHARGLKLGLYSDAGWKSCGGRPGSRGREEVWVRPLADGHWAAAFLNRGTAPLAVRFDWRAEEVEDTLSGRRLDAGHSVYRIRDVWAGSERGDTGAPFETEVPGHDVVLLRLRP